jgi:hypothetical protein
VGLQLLWWLCGGGCASQPIGVEEIPLYDVNAVRAEADRIEVNLRIKLTGGCVGWDQFEHREKNAAGFGPSGQSRVC